MNSYSFIEPRTFIESRTFLGSLTLHGISSVIVLAGSLAFGSAPVARAQGSPPGGTLGVRITRESASLTAGEWLEFRTVLWNAGATTTPPLAAHLSIAALVSGKHVDPEDWSPQRTQYLTPLEPGDSVQLSWSLHALFEGSFASFVTLVSTDESFAAVVSAPLRLQVAPDDILPWRHVIPVVAVVPILPLLLLVLAVAHSRRPRAGPGRSGRLT